MVAGGRRPRLRQLISVDISKQIVRLKDSCMTWAIVVSQLPVPVLKDTARNVLRSAERYRNFEGHADATAGVNSRESELPELNARLHGLCIALYCLGYRRIPITTGLLKDEARVIAANL